MFSWLHIVDWLAKSNDEFYHVVGDKLIEELKNSNLNQAHNEETLALWDPKAWNSMTPPTEFSELGGFI